MRVVLASLAAVTMSAGVASAGAFDSYRAACLDSGGAWTGTACGPNPPRPILERDLRRS